MTCDFSFYRRAHTAIFQGTLTNSKSVETFIKGVTPTHVTHGSGPYVWGIDKKKYIDFCCANGTNLFGYAHPAINRAIEDQLKNGVLFSLGSTTEVQAAELVKDRFSFVRKVKFLKSGTQACAAAIKIARAHTGRDLVLSEGYHGHADDFISLTPPASGIPKRDFIKSLTSLDQLNESVACVIVEPVMTDNSDARHHWLQAMIAKCKSVGALVIFDEIITGFRWKRLSVAMDYGYRPDIICLGKACAGGLPLAIVGLGEGIAENKPVFISSTYAGELLSMAAMTKVFEMLHNKYVLDELWKEGQAFLDDFNLIWPEALRIDGYATRGVFVGDQMVKALFFQESHKAGILFGPSWFIGFQHLGLRSNVISTCRDILQRIKTKSVALEGQMPSSPFAQKVREK